jgi:hypothetical protein
MRPFLLLLSALALGCAGSTHLGDDFGISSTTTFRGQACRPPAQVRPAATGLDSQEAAIVAETYRRSLAPKGQTAEEEQVLYVAPSPRVSNRPQLPPPSVPPMGR